MAFRDSFVRVIMRYWDAKFELTANQPWYRPSGSQMAAERPGSLQPSSRAGGHAQPANHQYYIIKLKETTFRSLAAPEQRLGLFTHRTSPSIGTPD